MKHLMRSTNPWILVLVIVLFAQSLMILALLSNQYDQRDDRTAVIADYNQKLAVLKYSSVNTMSRPVGSPSDGLFYLPAVRLSIPINEVSQELLYSTRNDTMMEGLPAVVDVDTVAHDLSRPLTPQRLACYPLRIAFENQSHPYNNHEKNAGSVKLADGRTLQMYTFTEDSCTVAGYTIEADGQALVDLFKQAKSY